MKRLCRELERHLESGVEHLPDALGAHLAGCAKCQRAWRLHQAYQRALHAARRAPTPACELPWTRVQAQLAARAVRRQPLAWARPALALGTAIVVVVLVVSAALFPFMAKQPSQGELLAHTHQAAPRVTNTHTGADTAIDATGVDNIAEQGVAPTHIELSAPPARIVADAAPRMRESARLLPPAPETPRTDAHATLDRRTMDRIEARRRDETAETLAFGMRQEQPFAVASLPLTPFRVGDQAAGVEYLPISYGSPSSNREGSNNEAVIGSF
jgi:hypothetical protein